MEGLNEERKTPEWRAQARAEIIEAARVAARYDRRRALPLSESEADADIGTPPRASARHGAAASPLAHAAHSAVPERWLQQLAASAAPAHADQSAGSSDPWRSDWRPPWSSTSPGSSTPCPPAIPGAAATGQRLQLGVQVTAPDHLRALAATLERAETVAVQIENLGSSLGLEIREARRLLRVYGSPWLEPLPAAGPPPQQ
jgi:hypothetical protein